MSKTMIRVNKNSNYVVLSKKGLEDTRLIWKAKGLLAYLLSLPDDWKIYQEELAKHSKDGVKSTASALKELINNGYIVRECLRDEKGRFLGYVYQVFEEPLNTDNISILSEMPKTENGKLDFRKGHTTKYPYILNNNLTLEDDETIHSEVDREIIKIYGDCISKKISHREYEMLGQLQHRVGKELLIKAIIIANMNNGKNLGYIEKLLEDWEEKGFKTLEEVNSYLEKWASMNKKAKINRIKKVERIAENKDYKENNSTFNNFEQRTYDYESLEKKLLGWE